MYLFDPQKLLSFGNVTDARQIQQAKLKQFTFHILLNGHFSASRRNCIFPRLDESVGFRSSSRFQRLDRCASMSKKTQKQLFLKKFGRFFSKTLPIKPLCQLWQNILGIFSLLPDFKKSRHKYLGEYLLLD